MAYYKCRDCHEVFHEDDVYRCSECGEYKLPSKLRGGYYCDDCLSKLSTMQTIRDYLAENIDDYAGYIYERQTGKK